MLIECPGCRHFTEVNDAEVLAQLDPKYPAQRVVINCKCGETQHILERKRPLGRLTASTTDRVSTQES